MHWKVSYSTHLLCILVILSLVWTLVEAATTTSKSTTKLTIKTTIKTTIKSSQKNSSLKSSSIKKSSSKATTQRTKSSSTTTSRTSRTPRFSVVTVTVTASNAFTTLKVPLVSTVTIPASTVTLSPSTITLSSTVTLPPSTVTVNGQASVVTRSCTSPGDTTLIVTSETCLVSATTLVSSCRTCSRTSTVVTTSTFSTTSTSVFLGMAYSTSVTTKTVTDLYRLIQPTCSITVTQSLALSTSTVKLTSTSCATARSTSWTTLQATRTQFIQSTQTVVRVLNAFGANANTNASCLDADKWGLASRTTTLTETTSFLTTSTTTQTSVSMSTVTAVVSVVATSTSTVPSILTLSMSVCENYTSIEFATSTITLSSQSTTTQTTNVQVTRTIRTTVVETTGTVWETTTQTSIQRNTFSTTVTVRWLQRAKSADEPLPIVKKRNVGRQDSPEPAAASNYARASPSIPIAGTNTAAYYENLVPTNFPDGHPVHSKEWFQMPNIQKPEPTSQEARILRASAYGVTPSSKDNTRGLNNAIDACRRSGKPCRVVLDPPNQTFVFDAGSSVFFGGLRNFTFDGLGGRMLFRNPRRPSSLMFVTDCKFCLWTNVYVDWDWDVWRLATRVWMEGVSGNRWTMTPVDLVEPDLPTPRRRQESVEISSSTDTTDTTSSSSSSSTTSTSSRTTTSSTSSTTTTLTPSPFLDISKIWQWTSFHMIHPSRRSMAVRGGDEYFRLENAITDARAISRTSLELRVNNGPNVKPGYFYLGKHFFYEQPCVSSEFCQHCTWERIWFVSCPGKVMTHDEDSEYLWMRDIKVAPITYPPPQDGPFTRGGDNGKGGGTGKGWFKQPITATADGLFFERIKGRIVIEDSEIGWHGDDSINVRLIYSRNANS
jgi:hypothetical protein